jgi:Ca-activated chloride channel family protein
LKKNKMKKIAAFFILICWLCPSQSFAQSGRRAAPQPKPSATTTTATPENLGVSDSVPFSRKSQTQTAPSLRGGEIPNPNAAPKTDGGRTADDEEVLKIDTSLVTIPVSVLDRQGNFVADLGKSDFKIFENGAEQQIAYFSTTEQPFNVILLLDVSPSTAFKIDEIHQAAIEFVNQLKPNDTVSVIAFDESVRVLTEQTNDRERIFRAIRRAHFGSGTSIYEAVDYVIRKSLAKTQGRKAVVLFSDGVDTTSFRATYDKTVHEAEEADAAFYTIYYNTYNDVAAQTGGYPGGGIGGVIFGGGYPRRGRGESREDYRHGEQYLEDLATKTGGRKYDASTTKNLQTAFYSIAEELRRQYSIGYYPSNAGNAGDRKQIKVRVTRSNLIVRARDSYIVGEKAAASNTTK